MLQSLTPLCCPVLRICYAKSKQLSELIISILSQKPARLLHFQIHFSKLNDLGPQKRGMLKCLVLFVTFVYLKIYISDI